MKYFWFLLFLLPLIGACSRTEEMLSQEIDAQIEESYVLNRTVDKPWRGEPWVDGSLGGTWRGAMATEPKSFNIHIAERDAATSAVVGAMQDWMVDYDTVRREWKPHAVSFEIIPDEAAGTLDVIYTLRDDLYWSFYHSEEKIPVTSDDVIFWYNEIQGNPAFQSSGYNSQFLLLEDGTEAHIDIKKIDDKRFLFHFPRIVSEPLLMTNGTIAPRYRYEEALRTQGVQGVLDLYSIETDPKTIPSMGKWFLTEYVPGQRLIYRRNPDYWDKDPAGISIPYYEEEVVRIIPDENTNFLLFKQGDLDSYTARPEDLDELIERKEKQEGTPYTLFRAEGSLGASFWTFNQNPVHKGSPKYEWFTQKEFRQAMSCLLNRERIITQVYRGLAEPKTYFFPPPNPFYNPEIRLQYLYSPERALELLASIGMKRDAQGVMRDSQGRAVEFDMTIRSESAIHQDIASIIMAELSAVGIKLNIRVLDFQKMVEQAFTTFEWESLIIGLSGGDIFPSQGSNVWPSNGNLHMWYPLQPEPATEWEARVDYLYNEGTYTIDREKAKVIWDEYQSIILEQCPLIYLVRPQSFVALLDRWDLSNVYFDNINGFETTHIFLKNSLDSR